MFDDVLKHRSGRVIALARSVLAAIFLIAIWIDPTQPAQSAVEIYGILTGYLVVSLGLAILTWDNWWRDARLAAPAHVLDVGMFTLLVLVSDGYTSPFFVFFVFLIVSAAIRWGWRETAVTAAAVTFLFFTAGLAAGDVANGEFELQRFIIRSGNLLTLSAILIWFGVNHGFAAFNVTTEDLLHDLSMADAPLETAVEGAARVSRASSAVLVWCDTDAPEAIAVVNRDGQVSSIAMPKAKLGAIATHAFLFDVARNRALWRGPHRRLRFSAAAKLFKPAVAAEFGIVQGLAVPIRTDAGEGLLMLARMQSLCTDHIEFGHALGGAVADHIQRHALLAAVEDGAAARARLSLARDLHDSIVQFLAGATFRVEAIRRTLKEGTRADSELKELKELLLLEQQELRSAIGALRSDRIPFSVLKSDLSALCGRLARQWHIRCTFAADLPDSSVPMRFHLDTHQLIRESVANAVRHAQAKCVDVQLTAEGSDLRLDISNDGCGIARLDAGTPWSLRERVDEANGTLMLASRPTGTSVSITLPMNAERRT